MSRIGDRIFISSEYGPLNISGRRSGEFIQIRYGATIIR
jgi:hypothetical protein